MNERTKNAVLASAEHVRVKYAGVPWTAEGVEMIVAGLTTDREDVDTVLAAIDALEAFAELLRTAGGRNPQADSTA